MILGSRAEQGMVDLKDLGEGVQETIAMTDLVSRIIELRSSQKAVRS